MWVRRVVFACVAGVAAFALAAAAVGELLSHPAHRQIGPAPHDFPVRAFLGYTPAGQAVAGWLATGRPGRGAVLLLHGVRADRTQMLARARFLNRSGYATLMIDLPAHGESAGDRITFGAREAAGVVTALNFLRREFPGEPVGVIGVSLGAASTVLAAPTPPPDAVILESMYPTIDDAVANRLTSRLGAWGAYLAPPLLWQFPLRADVHVSQLRPVEAVRRLGSPVLIMGGTQDPSTPWAETERIFAAASQPKELWRVEGAGHVDLHAFGPAAYEDTVLRFLARHMLAR